jgi:hypothetical protein
MRRPALIGVAVLVSAIIGHAAQTSDLVTGRVVSRDGVARPRCLVEFRDPKAQKSQKALGSGYTDARGYFSLKLPRGQYEVTITQGARKHVLTVTITAKGLNPSVLAVPW